MNELAAIGGLKARLRREAWPYASFMRRIQLAAERAPEGIRSPSISRFFGELAILTEAIRRNDYTAQAALRPRVVMLLPGLFTHPARMGFMRRQLEAAGHRVHYWGMGINLGPTEANFANLRQRVRALHARHEEEIVLVGWSLGGLFAREIAKLEANKVAAVVTMGSPFSGDPRANNAWRAYQFVAGHRVEDVPIACDPAVKPPVPTIAMWSPRDGIIAPRSAAGKPGERDRVVALRCTHLGFAHSREAVSAVLRELDAI